LLGQYLNCAAERIRLSYSESGKPFVVEPETPAGFGFNISHSDNLALLAFALTPEIGVDLEHVRSIKDREDIARRFFAPGEYAALSLVPSYDRDLAFYRCWTRKEAFLKARGTGIFRGLQNFEVSLIPDEPARLLKIDDAPEQLGEWSLHELLPCQSFIGSLALHAPDATVLLYNLAGT
jgi:4'-phosphopantetheinyl transferase